MTRRLLTPALAAALCGITLLSACGSDDEVAGDDTAVTGADTVDSDADAAPTTDSPSAVTASSDAGPVRIAASDYAFGGVPETIGAGTEIGLTNVSDVEVHELVAIRLPDDEERPVDELVQLPAEELATFFPFVEAVIIAPPGQEGFPVEGDGTLNEPGRYALICVIPTGADPDEYLAAAAEAEGGPPQVDGGPPHIVEGMFAELTVE